LRKKVKVRSSSSAKTYASKQFQLNVADKSILQVDWLLSMNQKQQEILLLRNRQFIPFDAVQNAHDTFLLFGKEILRYKLMEKLRVT